MTPDAFGRVIAVYPALLRAYAGEPVMLSAEDALALLEIFDAVSEPPAAVAPILDPLGDRYPALERWRRSVLESGRRRTPLERAAAWEATALACERVGAAEDAESACRQAWAIVSRSAA